jgi:hypothetical protein
MTHTLWAVKDVLFAWSCRISGGQRVRLSEEGRKARLRPKSKWAQRGTVLKVDKWNSPTVLWDGYKTASGYHPRFIVHVRKPRS